MDNSVDLTSKSNQNLSSANTQARTNNMKFFGHGSEYFSIWIVNVLLTIVTLGIYSAWAKVRNERYFHSNTEVDGHRFKYHATPIQILKGRIIALILFIAFYIISALSPAAAGVVLLIYFIAAPWLLIKSFKFNLQMKSYRNVRFSFHGQYGQAFLVFILYPVLSVFTLYLALPASLKAMDKYIYQNISYGNKNVNTNLSTAVYYKASLGAVVISIILFAIGAMIFGIEFSNMAQGEALSITFQIALMATYLAVFIVAGAFYTTTIRNHVFANTEIDQVAQFQSNLTISGLIWLRATNLVALILTAGLALAWIKVRNANYMCSITQVSILASADDVVATQSAAENAIGDEVAEAFDFDVAIT